MMNFHNPTSIIFGNGALGKLPTILSDFGKRVLFLSGVSSLDNNEIFQEIYPKIKPYIAKRISGIPAMPDLADMLEIITKCGGEKYDAILAVGGGSVIDSAKALSCLYTNRSQSVDGLRKAILNKKFATNKPAIIAVPTTAGTGSETNQLATLWDREKNTRHMLGDDSTFISYAIIDSRLSATMPANVTASTGLDTLCHAIEGMWALNSNPISRIYAAKAMSLVFANLEQALKNNTAKHRQGMALASALAGVSLSISKTTLPHAISYPLTLNYNVTHGLACALTLSEVYMFNKGAFAEEDSFSEVLVKGLHHQSLGNYIKHICAMAELPSRLGDFGIKREDLPNLAEQAFEASANIANNCRPVTIEDIQDILKRSY